MTMKKYIILILLLSTSVLVLSQDKNRRWVYPPYGRSLGTSSVIDTSFVEIYYAFNADNLKEQDTYKDYQCLEVGRFYVKYYSIFMIEAEKKQQEWIKEHPKAQSIPNFFPKTKDDNWSEYQYSDYYIYHGTLTEFCAMPSGLSKDNCFHKEPYPKQIWQIMPETKQICNIPCQKAVCHFSGRNYVAWFARSIPLKYGPFKFGGLPGLILKVEDSKHLYSFECVKIEKKKKEIILHEYKGYRERKRTDILKLQRLANEDWFKISGFINAKTGEVMSKFVPYNPLELE